MSNNGFDNKHKKIFYLKAKKIDIDVGESFRILLNEEQAWLYDIKSVDSVGILHMGENFSSDFLDNIVEADLTKDLVDFGEIGITNDVHKKFGINEGDFVGVYAITTNPLSIQAIRKKLMKKKLNEEEIFAITKDMANNKISDTLVTYYAASSFFYEGNKDELYRSAKASAEFGNKIKFDGITAVKYCIGGVPGNETTMIIVPILASLGIKIPKTFSKSITSPAATGECVEALMDIDFTPEQMKNIVDTTGGCLVYGKNLGLAPANDRIIKVSYPISMESFSKMVVSIVAKIYAGGATHCLIDIPVGPTAKVKEKKEANKIKGYFDYIGKRLGMKMKVLLTDGNQPIGNGIGANLQLRDVLRILQQHQDRSIKLEEKAIYLASKLLVLTGYCDSSSSYGVAKNQVLNGSAWKKMQEIMIAQNANNIDIFSEDLIFGQISKDIVCQDNIKNGIIKSINMKYLNDLARALGCPLEKKAGIYLNKRIGEIVNYNDILFTLFSEDKQKMSIVLDMLKTKSLYEIS